MSQSRWFKPALLLLAAALLLAAHFAQSDLNRQRAKYGLTEVAPLKDAPPLLAFTTVALGGFRGLISNVLWIRATDLQDEGKYFEMVQLADWITKLQPHMAQVWAMQAWNMAYNISVKFKDAADRWRWVQRGIELLRDQGIVYNPTEALVYRELAWFFQHKMGQNLDDAHLYYKAEWARQMNSVLGGGHPDWDELIHPQTEDQKKRAQTLEQTYKMDPRIMKKVDQIYGPLEWRLPETSAIYWAYVGLQKSSPQNLIMLRRIIYQSMQIAFDRGRLVRIGNEDTLLFEPNLDILPKTNAAYEQMIREDVEMRDNIKTAHRNFLTKAVYLLYVSNRLKEADHWLGVLKREYPESLPARVNLDAFVLAQLAADIENAGMDRAKAVIEGLIGQAYFQLAIDEDERATGLEHLAHLAWTKYQERTKGQKRIMLSPFDEIKQRVLQQLLDPKNGMNPELIARLRTRLQLPAPSAQPSTNTTLNPSGPG